MNVVVNVLGLEHIIFEEDVSKSVVCDETARQLRFEVNVLGDSVNLFADEYDALIVDMRINPRAVGN